MAEHRDAFQVRRSAVHVENGVIRLADDGDVRLTGFAPEDYSRNRSPIPFDAGAECPRFLQELLLPAMSAEDVDLLQRWAGMAITGRNPAQRIVILTGTSAGGKTTTASTIGRIIGAENTYQLRTEVLAERFEVYRYRAKTLLVGADVPGDFLQRRGAGVLKALVGGDILAAEAKGLNSDLVLRGEFLVLITCNSRLKVRLEGDTAAWRRRLIVFEFKNPPPARRITDFDQVLVREEGAGILRWCLQGFVKAHAELQEHGDLILTDTQRERVDALLCESDSVRHFVQEALSRSDDTDVSVEELTQAYAAFCTDKRWSPLDINEVTGQLPDLLLQIYGVTKRHDIRRYGKSVRGYSGIAINNPLPSDEP